VTVEGSVFDDGASRVEGSSITRLDTRGSDVSFFFHLADATASSNETTLGEPVLSVASNAVTLGAGDAGIATTGDLLLLGGAGPAIDAGGATIVLIADSNFDGRGALQASGSGNPDIENAGGLVAFAGAGVGTADAPLRTTASTATGRLSVAGTGGTGDFQLVNENASGTDVLTLETQRLAVVNDGVSQDVSVRGIEADGEVVLDNGGGPVVLGAIQPDADVESVLLLNSAPNVGLTGDERDGLVHFAFGNVVVSSDDVTPAVDTEVLPHVTRGGGQTYGGPVLLSNASDLGNVARVEAGGPVDFQGDVGTAPAQDPGSLTVAAPLAIFAGDVGVLGRDVGVPGTMAPLASLTTGDVQLPDVFAEEDEVDHRIVVVENGDFGRRRKRRVPGDGVRRGAEEALFTEVDRRDDRAGGRHELRHPRQCRVSRPSGRRDGSPGAGGGVAGAGFGYLSEACATTTASCPALRRASTSLRRAWQQDVDGRDKPGHDGV
jgi:hypothetical protein